MHNMRLFRPVCAIAFAGLLIFISACTNADYSDIPTITDLSFAVVDTGQAEFSNSDGETIDEPSEGDAFYGQDAAYDGYEFSFTDNGDGTVTDNQTGLMWEQSPDDDGLSWEEAEDYCDDLSLAGYTDWRLPTAKELFSISDFESGWPYIDTDYFNLALEDEISKDEQYWSSNFYEIGTTHGGQDTAFGVNHVTGHIKGYPSDVTGQYGNYVRAVRGSSVYGENDFTDNSDGTISDAASGLMWAQDDSGEGLDWEAALDYAENLDFAGYTDWRLPNIKELQSIVDYTQTSLPAIDPLFSCTGIVNEAGDSDYPYYWSGTSAYFSESSTEYYYAWYTAFGYAVDDDGADLHGAGSVRFDTKVEGGPLGEGGERYYNYVRVVRDID